MVSQSDNWKRVNKDDLREMIDCSLWSKSNEKFILHIRNYIVTEALRKGKNVIVDDTNFEDKHFQTMCDIARSCNKDIMVREIYFPVELEEAIKRDAQREKHVGEQIIRHFYKKYIHQKTIQERCETFHKVEELTPQQYSALPEAVICDLDGTLAILNGRNPYDASTCENDILNKPVAEVIKQMAISGRKIIFVSGREDKYRGPTERFIHNHLDDEGTLKEYSGKGEERTNHPFEFELYMRRTKDMRKDTIIKREIFERHIRNRYKILFVLDDRPSVVRMWRYELGLTVFQLNDKEF
jgi:predicted kinase